MSKTLLTRYDLLRSFPMAKEADTALLREHITLEEQAAFRDLLGWDFYLKLLEDKLTYPDATKFISGESYLTGAEVYEAGLSYIALQNTLGKPLSDEDYWQLQPTYADADWQELWETYLRRYLSTRVFASAVMFSHYQLSGQGLQKKFSETSEAINQKELQQLLRKAGSDAERWLKIMDKWLCEKATKFPLYTPQNSEEDIVGTGKVKRRKYGFNTRTPSRK